MFASGAGDGLLLAEGHVELRQIDADGSLVGLATGVRLWMRTDGSSGILRGSPAEVVQHGSDGRVGIARSLSLRLTSEAGEQIVTLMREEGYDPVIEVRGGSGDEQGRSVRNTRIICRGPVLALPTEILFDGPVHVQALDEDGEVDPQGLDLISDRMTMTRDPKAQTIERITALGNVVLRFQDYTAQSDEMILDQASTTWIVKSQGGQITITVGGRPILAEEMWLNYRTYAVNMWGVHWEGNQSTIGSSSHRVP